MQCPVTHVILGNPYIPLQLPDIHGNIFTLKNKFVTHAIEVERLGGNGVRKEYYTQSGTMVYVEESRGFSGYAIPSRRRQVPTYNDISCTLVEAQQYQQNLKTIADNKKLNKKIALEITILD
jgi:hypothetical protein